MSLKYTIKRVLKESKSEKIIELINKHGIKSIINMVGSYKKLKDLIGRDIDDKIKIDIIKDFVYENDFWINLNESENTIFYKSIGNEQEDIEYLSIDNAVVRIYEKVGDDWEHVDEYGVPYEELPDDIIDTIFDLVISDKI